MSADAVYPIGAAGRAWGERERDAWRARQPRQRSYDDDVVARIDTLVAGFDRILYGRLVYGEDAYALHALRSRPFDPALPTALITGGVHGYETSGVLGALDFLEHHASGYSGRVNLLVIPCVSPWGYERVHRWNYDAVDPNRSFRSGAGSPEAAALSRLVHDVADRYLLHIDLHETTDSDESEFRPALAARDGQVFQPDLVPDGFYLVADVEEPQLAFQQAIISAVETITHIAAPDAGGRIIGSPVILPGVIAYPGAELALCTSITAARFRTTTEVYPDSIRTTPDICVRAQVTAIRTALDFALKSVPES